ncbi:MAG: radical SAM protein [Candidatus Eisenbacteria bacterium]
MPSTLDRLWYEVRQYRRGLPTVASFDITERCLYHCKMCRFWIDGDHDESRELKADQICALIDELAEDLGVRRIRLLGGEPFLRPDVMDIVRHAKSRGIHVNVVSEGSLVDEAMAEEIVASGLDSIRFSVDGLGVTHDIVRGKPGAFADVARAIRSVQDAKMRLRSTTPEVQIFAVVSSLNFDQILPLYEACRSESAPIRFLFGPVWEATADEVVSSVWRGKQLADRHHLPIGKSLQLERGPACRAGTSGGVHPGLQDTSRLTRVPVGLVGRLAVFASPFLSREHCPETNCSTSTRSDGSSSPVYELRVRHVPGVIGPGDLPSRKHRDSTAISRDGSCCLQGSVRPRERLLRRHAPAALRTCSFDRAVATRTRATQRTGSSSSQRTSSSTRRRQ